MRSKAKGPDRQLRRPFIQSAVKRVVWGPAQEEPQDWIGLGLEEEKRMWKLERYRSVISGRERIHHSQTTESILTEDIPRPKQMGLSLRCLTE